MRHTRQTIARPLPPSPAVTAVVLVGSLLLAVSLLWSGPATAQPGTEFPDLDADRRVYDQTGESLSSAQVADLEQRLDDLLAAGADAVVVVRELDASPEETLAQVEALQQNWAARTGADPDIAAAILINRNPDDPQDARAGVFVGRTFQEGNVPTGEQRAIVDDALIPPLRDGDVHASLAAGIDRLTTSVIDGPPVSDFDVWAEGAADTWLPWAAILLAMMLTAVAFVLFSRRQTVNQIAQTPTIIRPGDLPPALAASLAAGTPKASAMPATLLDLATRGAVDIEQEKDGGRFSAPTIQVRLQDATAIDDPIGAALWAALQDQADGDLVPSKGLQKIVSAPKGVRTAVQDRMRAEGWVDPDAAAPRAGLIVVGVLGLGLAVATLIITIASGQPWPSLLGVIALAVLLPVTLVLHTRFSRLSRSGQEAAAPWRAYHAGLKTAVKDEDVSLDLDAVLPDLVAADLAAAAKDRIAAVGESGATLRAFTSSTQEQDLSPAMYVALWAGFQSSAVPSGGGGTATVSGAGAGGGGGAAGST